MENPRYKIVRIGNEQVGKRISSTIADPEYPAIPGKRRRAQELTTISGDAFLAGGSVKVLPEKDVYRIKKTGHWYMWRPLYRTRVVIAEWNMDRKIKSEARSSRRRETQKI